MRRFIIAKKMISITTDMSDAKNSHEWGDPMTSQIVKGCEGK